MPLDSRAVDAIHTRLLARYGTRWTALYAGVPPEAVKADWADVLDGVQPQQIRRALGNLPPDYVPNAAQFRALALSGPPPMAEQTRLHYERPPADRARLVAMLSRIGELQAKRGPKSWAYDLRERERQGEDLSEWQRAAWRRALNAQGDDGVPPDIARTARLKDESLNRAADYAEQHGIDLNTAPQVSDATTDYQRWCNETGYGRTL